MMFFRKLWKPHCLHDLRFIRKIYRDFPNAILMVDHLLPLEKHYHSTSFLLADNVSQIMYSLSSSSPKPTKQKIRTCSLQLMERHNLIYGSPLAGYTLLPIAVKALEKLTLLVEEEMQKVGAQKIIMPCLVPLSLYKTSGRLDLIENEIFKLEDRKHRKLCLAPTHEEIVTSLLEIFPKGSCRHLPLRLYQVTPKFRNEMRPSHGLLRAREFLMKDLYTFDVSEEKARETYRQIRLAYKEIFRRIGIKTVEIRASVGSIGGRLSHEYHFLSDAGDDKLLVCTKCQAGFNTELEDVKECPECNSDSLQEVNGIEVGHTFLLGTKYSEAFDATIASQTKEFVQMGCFGLGLSRILAASIEVLSTEDSIRWPMALCPYLVCIIPPKAGSKEDAAAPLANDLESSLSTIPNLKGNVLFDDRTHLTIGNRLKTIASLGVPYIVVIGKQALEASLKMELHDIYNRQIHALTQKEVFDFFRSLKS